MSTIELPVKLGDKIYVVPSEENFLINALYWYLTWRFAHQYYLNSQQRK